MCYLRYDELILNIMLYIIFNTICERDLLYVLEQDFSFRSFDKSHKHAVCKDGAHDYYVEQCNR